MGSTRTLVIATIIALLAFVATSISAIHASAKPVYIARIDGYAYVLFPNGTIAYFKRVLEGEHRIMTCNNVSVYLDLVPRASRIIVESRGNIVHVIDSAYVRMPILWRFEGYVKVHKLRSGTVSDLYLHLKLAYRNGQIIHVFPLKSEYALKLPKRLLELSNITISCSIPSQSFSPFYASILSNTSKARELLSENASIVFAEVPIEFEVEGSINGSEIKAYSPIHIGGPYVAEVSHISKALCLGSPGKENLLVALGNSCISNTLGRLLSAINGTKIKFVCSRCVYLSSSEAFVVTLDNVIGYYRGGYPVTLFYVPIPRYCYPKVLREYFANGLLVLVVGNFSYVYPRNFNPMTIPYTVSVPSHARSVYPIWVAMVIGIGIAVAIVVTRVVRR